MICAFMLLLLLLLLFGLIPFHASKCINTHNLRVLDCSSFFGGEGGMLAVVTCYLLPRLALSAECNRVLAVAAMVSNSQELGWQKSRPSPSVLAARARFGFRESRAKGKLLSDEAPLPPSPLYLPYARE